MNQIIKEKIKEIKSLCQKAKNVYFGDEYSLLQHMTASARLAMKLGFDEEFILAAFFHDIGNLQSDNKESENMVGFGVLNHEYLGADFLRKLGFSEKITHLVENHVKAKRYLTYANPDYYKQLPMSSKHALAFQGGTMRQDEAEEFQNEEFFELNISLRQVDDDSIDEIKFAYDCEIFIKIAEKHLIDRHINNYDLDINLVDKLNEIIKKKSHNELIAVFDLDNTLLDGDIGEATFAQLKADGEFKDFSYANYLQEIENGNFQRAFLDMAVSMKGLTIEKLIQTTHKVLNKKGQMIEFKENNKNFYSVAPSANRNLLNMLLFLKANNFKIKIISSSPDIIVKTVATRLFGIDPKNSIGLKNKTKNGILTEELLEPIPIADGKEQVYKSIFNNTPPIISAGDSINDAFLLKLTSLDGIVILRKNRYLEFLKNTLPQNLTYFIF